MRFKHLLAAQPSPAALTHDVAPTIWSPLAGGLLTGKYLDGGADPGARLKPDDAWGSKHFTPAADRAVRALAAPAADAGVR